MKLYAYQPQGHGGYSFFVVAESEEKARSAIDLFIEDHFDKDDDEDISTMSISGWGTDYYEITELEPMKVITNAND